MASFAPRRASYHLETERRSSVKSVGNTTERLTRDEKVDEQSQQPSPQLIKSRKLGDSNDADNNQEEESTGDVDAIRPASPVTSSIKVDQKPQRLQHHRTQAAAQREPPLTNARLRQENAALRLQLSQLGNQHDSEIHVLKRQLAEAAAARSQVEQNLKRQIDELEKRQLEAAESARKYQAHVEILQQLVHRLEGQAKSVISSPRTPSKPPQSVACPPSDTPWGPSSTPRIGSESQVPRRSPITRSGGIKPFAWRAEGVQVIHGAEAKPSQSHPRNVNRTSFVPTFVAPPRCIPVPTNVLRDTAPTNGDQYVLPPPLSVAKEQQQRIAHLTKKPSGGSLLSYCAEMITSKLAAHTAPASTPKPNMKVTPVWSPEDDVASASTPRSNGITIPAPASQACMDEYTAITIL